MIVTFSNQLGTEMAFLNLSFVTQAGFVIAIVGKFYALVYVLLTAHLLHF